MRAEAATQKAASRTRTKEERDKVIERKEGGSKRSFELYIHTNNNKWPHQVSECIHIMHIFVAYKSPLHELSLSNDDDQDDVG